jgi:AcrR family transcriptional regulator
VSQRLQALNSQHKAAARLKVEGKSIKLIAKELGVTTRTLHVWFSDETVKAEVRRLTERVDEIFVERLASSGLQALEKLTDIAIEAPRPVDPNGREIGMHDDERLKYLESILDRVDRTTKLKDRVAAGEGGDTNYQQIFMSMPDEKLAELMGVWASSNGHGRALPGPDSG